MTNPTTYDYLSTFISHSLSAPISQYNHQDKYTTITINKTQKSSFKNRNQNFDNFNSNKKKSNINNDDTYSNQDKDKDTIEKEIEEVKRRNREKERLRRERLEREAQENLFGDGSETSTSNEDDIEEEEIIEL